jgi:hypothetical protein
MAQSRRSDVEKVVGNALESASPASVIAGLMEDRDWDGPVTIHPSVITLKTTDGRQLRISTLNSKSSSRAELVSRGKTVDAAPSGTFKLVGGKSLTIKEGRLTGGTAASGSDMRNWAVFALLPADRELGMQ